MSHDSKFRVNFEKWETACSSRRHGRCGYKYDNYSRAQFEYKERCALELPDYDYWKDLAYLRAEPIRSVYRSVFEITQLRLLRCLQKLVWSFSGKFSLSLSKVIKPGLAKFGRFPNRTIVVDHGVGHQGADRKALSLWCVNDLHVAETRLCCRARKSPET